MPENDHPKPERPPLRPSQGTDTGIVPYVELHCRTNFSFHTGASHPDELVQRAADLGYHALAITDINSLAGVVRAHTAARQVGLKLLIGTEVVSTDGPAVVLLATDRAAYGRLSRLLTLGRRRAPKGECQLTRQDLADHAEGLLACVVLRSVPQTELSTHLRWYRDRWGDRCYGLLSLHHGPNDRAVLDRMQAATTAAGVPLVASNDVHYHVAQRRFLQDVVTAIRHHCTVAELGGA
ncbi:MAG: PHP domain-containing protein, partial [Planctomycetaceae bacterium]|nr:PHP domain-containing protein [Planctomycetaceae bacterium]